MVIFAEVNVRASQKLDQLPSAFFPVAWSSRLSQIARMHDSGLQRPGVIQMAWNAEFLCL